jgi:hypothetical protein
VCEAGSPVPHLYGYDFRDLAEAGFAAETVQHIARNSSGTLLHLDVHGGPSWIASVTMRSIGPAREHGVFLADDIIGLSKRAAVRGDGLVRTRPSRPAP